MSNALLMIQLIFSAVLLGGVGGPNRRTTPNFGRTQTDRQRTRNYFRCFKTLVTQSWLGSIIEPNFAHSPGGGRMGEIYRVIFSCDA